MDAERRRHTLVHVRLRTDDLVRVSQASCQRSRLQAVSTDGDGPIGRALSTAVAGLHRLGQPTGRHPD